MSQSRSIKGTMFGGLVEIQCFLASDKAKACLIFNLSQLSQIQGWGSIEQIEEQVEETENAMQKLIIQMGMHVLDNKTKQNQLKFIINGDRKVEKAINNLMQAAKKGIIVKKGIKIKGKKQYKLTSYENKYFEKSLETFRKNLSQEINNKQTKNDKIISKDRSIFITNSTPKSHLGIPPSSHEVYLRKIKRKGRKGIEKEKDYFIKKADGTISQIEAFGSEVNRLLLGKDRVSRSFVVYDENGMRRGIASRKIEGFKPLTSEDTDDIAAFSVTLIKKGIGKIETANFILGNVDGHFNNVGYSQNGAGPLCSIDYDQIFWELTCIYKGYHPDQKLEEHHLPSPKQTLKVNEKDILSLPNVKHSVRGLKHEYLNTLKVRDDVLNDMAADPRFIKDKWYTFLRYLLIGEKAYDKLLKTFFTSTKHKKELHDYVIQRRNKFKIALQNIDEFKTFISQPEHLQEIKDDFAKEYKGKEVDLKELGLDSDSIDLEFKNIFTITLEEKQLEKTPEHVDKNTPTKNTTTTTTTPRPTTATATTIHTPTTTTTSTTTPRATAASTIYSPTTTPSTKQPEQFPISLKDKLMAES